MHSNEINVPYAATSGTDPIPSAVGATFQPHKPVDLDDNVDETAPSNTS